MSPEEKVIDGWAESDRPFVRYCPCGYSHDIRWPLTRAHTCRSSKRAAMQAVDNAVFRDCETRGGTDA